MNENRFQCLIRFVLCIEWKQLSITVNSSIMSNGFLPELRLGLDCSKTLYYQHFNVICNRQSGKKTIEWDCVLEITIKLRIGSFNQLLLGSILTVFIRLIHDYLLEKSTNPPKLLFILSLLVKVFRACDSNLTYLKQLSAYQHSLFNIQ